MQPSDACQQFAPGHSNLIALKSSREQTCPPTHEHANRRTPSLSCCWRANTSWLCCSDASSMPLSTPTSRMVCPLCSNCGRKLLSGVSECVLHARYVISCEDGKAMKDDQLLGLRFGLHAFSHHYRRWALLDSSKATAGLLALPMVEPELHPASVTKAPVLITRASRAVIVPMSQNGGTTRPDIELIESTNDSSVQTLKS